jgi:transcriptional antiterminator RfaH
MPERWYVAFTDGQRERETCGEIQELGFPAYVPLEKLKRFRRGKKKIIEAPLFPCYLFAKFDAFNARWNLIRSIAGIRDILCNQGQPQAVPIGLIEKLQRMQVLGLFDHTKAPMPFPPGTSVILDDDGPFADLIGKVMRVRTGDRVDLLINYLNREMSVNVSLARLSHI